MKKIIIITVIGFILFAAPYVLDKFVPFHDYWNIMVIFFVVQNFVIFRIERLATEGMKAQIRLVNIGVRMISSMTFVLVLALSAKSNIELLLIEFIILYLVFMTFEIILALTNLRRN